MNGVLLTSRYVCIVNIIIPSIMVVQVLKILERELVNLSAVLSSFLLQENTKLPWIGMIVGLNLMTNLESIMGTNRIHSNSSHWFVVFSL